MSEFRIVSFYTDDSIYREEVKKLIASIEKFKLKSYIEKIDPDVEKLRLTIGREDYNHKAYENGWRNFVNYKPHFILKCLDLFEENIVWVDADAIIQQYPVLFESIEEDFAVFSRMKKEFRDSGKKHTGEVLSGTLFCKNCKETREILNKWIEEYPKHPRGCGGQISLGYVIKRENPNWRSLPAPYTLIFDAMKDEGPPVIEHFQASRMARIERTKGLRK